MELIDLALSCALIFWCLRLRAQSANIEHRLAEVVRDSVSYARMRDLERRMAVLEKLGPEHAAPEPPPDHAAAPKPVSAVPHDEEQSVVVSKMPASVREVEGPGESQPEPAPVARDRVAAPTLSEQLHGIFGRDEWEMLVGGSVLNKVGAVVLVIGISLFLAYSFAHINAAGRASLALVTSSVILGAGVCTERRARYRAFSRGLIGAGWAGLYASAYAIYAIPASRIIESPLAGSVGMFVVALGMIAHSLRYRSQAATATAYFAAFAALAVSPSNPVAIVSLIPLSASLLYLAARFGWYQMALFGLASTWLTCITRAQSGAPLAEAQTLFLVYWLLFEGFDLLRTHRRVEGGACDLIYTVNLASFLSLSYWLWSNEAPNRLWFAAALGSLLFFADALARLWLRPPVSFGAEGDFAQRVRSGSYEPSLFLASLFTGLAIAGRMHGIWEVAALATESELLYLGGARFNSAFLRSLGIVGFFASLAGTAVTPGDDQRIIALVFQAALFYWNRAVRRQDRFMSFAATFLLAIAIAIKAPTGYLAAAESGLAVLALAAGLAGLPEELQLCYGPLAAAGAGIAIGEHLSDFMRFPGRGVWIDFAGIALAAWLATFLWTLRSPSFMKQASAWLAAVATMVTLWLVTPDPWMSMLGCVLAVALFETGFRRQALSVAGVIWCGQYEPGLEHVRLPAIPLIVACLYWLWHRLGRNGLAATSLSWAAACAGVFFIGKEAIDYQAPVFFALWMLALLAAGIRATTKDLRVQSYAVTALTVIWSLGTDIEPPRLVVSTLTAATLFGAALLARRCEEKWAPAYFSALATFLVTAILWGEVSGGLLTTCWAFAGLALLAAGFLVRGRTLRLEGLGLLLVCVLKAFLYDLRNLETVYRILSFVALGLILLAVSWIYTRFREHIERLLR